MVHKNNTAKKRRSRSNRGSAEKAKVLPSTLGISGTKFVNSYRFDCGNEVPIYEAYTVHALNQLIGHAKFNNQSYGNVYYRGECKIHPTIKPALFRNSKNAEAPAERISQLIRRFVDDPHMQRELKITPTDIDITKYRIEGMLQHYGVPTRFVDVVDNHWVALWMGMNRCERLKQYNHYCCYAERNIPFVEMVTGDSVSEDLLFQYILLMAIPFSSERTYSGVQSSSDYIEVDLRQALPSTFCVHTLNMVW